MIKLGLLLAVLFLPGCSMLFGLRPDNLTPEQIEAYSKVSDVYSCFKVGGPPPIGGLTVLTVPHGTKADLGLSPNCDLLKANTSPGP